MNGVGATGGAMIETLQFEQQFLDRFGVEEFAVVGGAKELAKLGVIERQRRGTAFGEGGVPLVEDCLLYTSPSPRDS